MVIIELPFDDGARTVARSVAQIAALAILAVQREGERRGLDAGAVHS
jgi:hypothetical protein